MPEPLVRFTAKNGEFRPAPINPAWIEGGDPQASVVILAQSDDRATTTVLWHCTAGKFTWRYNVDETIHILDGGVTINAEGQPERRLGPGDTLHFARGAVATWTVDSHVRKVAFCRRAPPRRIAQALRIAREFKRGLGARLRNQPGGLVANPLG
jgi:uncharacterized cupin superfamily protein